MGWSGCEGIPHCRRGRLCCARARGSSTALPSQGRHSGRRPAHRSSLPHPSCPRRQAPHSHTRHAREGRHRTPTPVMPAQAGTALPRSSCLRRQASHSHTRHASEGRHRTPTPVMPAKAGIALPHPSCLRRQASHFHTRHACEGRHRTPTPVMPAKAGTALPHPSCLRRQAPHFHTRHACEGRHRTFIRQFCGGAFRQSKSFRLPAAAELLFSCVAKRKVTKREGHPAWRLPGILPGKSVSRGRAFRQHIPVLAKRHRHPADARCAACRPRLTAAQGTPGRAAGHRGPHSVRNRVAVAKSNPRCRRWRATRLFDVPATGRFRPKADLCT